MTEEDAAVLLEQMLDAAQCAVSYVEGLSKADFLDDRRTREAVALNLMVIGELAPACRRVTGRSLRLIRRSSFAKCRVCGIVSRMVMLR